MQKATQIKKNQLVYLVIAIVFVIAWCAFIFYMSAFPADDSSAISDRFSFKLMCLVWPDFATMSADSQQYWCDVMSYPVRKAAHFSEYTLLGILVANLLMRVKSCVDKEPDAQLSLRSGVAAWAIATLYAVSDEIHQLFVPGRACLPTDVLIDSAGALLGVLIFVLVSRFIIKRRNQRLKRN